MRPVHGVLAALLLALPAAADEGAGSFLLGADVFRAGDSVPHDAAGADNLFLAGETVRQEAAIAGSGHLAGRRVAVAAGVGGALYAAGMDVAVTAEVAGDATLMGYDIALDAPLGGNLRAFAARARIGAPVGGTALIGAERVTIDAPIAGDVAIAAERLEFGPDARIDGTLRLYGDRPERLEVPESVIAPERVSRHPRADWRELERPGPTWLQLLGGFVGGVVFVAALAALIAAVAPQTLAEMRRRILARPFATLGWGFLALSAAIGAAVVLALTVVGIFVSPAALALAALGAFLGYVVGAYSFGAGLMIAVGRGEPETLGARALAALVGALLAGLIALIPLAGWLFVLALVLAGVGAITLRAFRPAFFAA